MTVVAPRDQTGYAIFLMASTPVTGPSTIVAAHPRSSAALAEWPPMLEAAIRPPPSITMRGPGQANWDISVFKTFSIAEKYRAQFRAEALNALNTPLFRAPNTAFGNSAFGTVTAQANFPRLIQLGLRFYF